MQWYHLSVLAVVAMVPGTLMNFGAMFYYDDIPEGVFGVPAAQYVLIVYGQVLLMLGLLLTIASIRRHRKQMRGVHWEIIRRQARRGSSKERLGGGETSPLQFSLMSMLIALTIAATICGLGTILYKTLGVPSLTFRLPLKDVVENCFFVATGLFVLTVMLCEILRKDE